MPKVTAEEAEAHWTLHGSDHRLVPLTPLLHFKGSTMQIWFGTLKMVGVELTGV